MKVKLRKILNAENEHQDTVEEPAPPKRKKRQPSAYVLEL
jgi:hypothetical protein